MRADRKELAFVAEADSWIEMRESLQSVSVSGPTVAETIEIPRPLRFGFHWLHVRRGDEFFVRRVYPTDADGAVIAGVHCSESPEFKVRIDWLRRAGHIAAAGPVDPQTLAALLAEARALVVDAASAADTALAQHLYAQVFSVNGMSVDANASFALAESAWNRAGNPAGAQAARLGRIEGLLQASSYEGVLELTVPPATVTGSASYLFVRAEYERCIALASMGRLDEAEKCLRWTFARYRTLRESVEVEIVRQALAGVNRDLGNFDAARRLGEQGVREASGPEAGTIRGRNLLLLADLSLRSGDIAQALQQLNAALDEFSVAKSARWQANAYMKLADLYNEVGSLDEAYAALGQAAIRLNARDAPSRVAVSLLTLADLERRAGRNTSALLWARAAESMFVSLNMPDSADGARVLRVSLQVASGMTDTRALAMPPIETVPAEDAGKWRLARARLAMLQDQPDAARGELDQLALVPLSLSDRTQATLLSAEQQAAGGDIAGAERALYEAALRVRALALRAHSEVLRHVIKRQDLELRRAGIRLLLEHDATGGTGADSAWQWLALNAEDERRARAAAAGDSTTSHDEAFDRAVGTDLLGGARQRTGASGVSAQRSLLARLAAKSGDSAAPKQGTPTVSLAELQSMLPAEAAFIAYVDGATRGALLWVTREDVRLVPAPAAERVSIDTVALLAATKDRGASLAEIQRTAQTLSDDLLGGLRHRSPPPHRLYVLADSVLRGVPWSVLAWPGTTTPLVETTAVATIVLGREQQSKLDAAPSQPIELRVFVSSQRNAAIAALPVLAGAEVEAEEIRKAGTAHGLRTVEDAHATRASVDRALGESGNWVHIAAHGIAEPQRIGYSGLWLEPVAPETAPAFLSWIDVLEGGVRNDLVVLDACQSGDSGTAINGNLSFADAVVRAGARRVVAVMWPISDTASTKWVPAFYTALLADESHDAAEALRNAQQELRAMRAFSHPFYWAGAQVIERWPIGADPTR